LADREEPDLFAPPLPLETLLTALDTERRFTLPDFDGLLISLVGFLGMNHNPFLSEIQENFLNSREL
jgi:hypothetical protein